MGKQALAILVFFLVIVVPMVQSIEKGSQDVDEWFKTLPHAKQKVTHLHFYFHDQISGKNPTAVTVAQTNKTFTTPTLFGLVVVIDDPLTEGPEPTSKLLGQAKGLYASSGQQEASMVMTMNLVFTTGKFNGSTLAILGHNAALTPLREMPIVGGTGVFRLACGSAIVKTYMFNSTTGDAIAEFNVYAIHY